MKKGVLTMERKISRMCCVDISMDMSDDNIRYLRTANQRISEKS
jgi:hypothetical protein